MTMESLQQRKVSFWEIAKIKLSSDSPYCRVACFKHLLMTHKLCVSVLIVFFWCRKDWRNWFRWNAKIDTCTLFVKVPVPQKWTSSNIMTHFRLEGHIFCSRNQTFAHSHCSARPSKQIDFEDKSALIMNKCLLSYIKSINQYFIFTSVHTKVILHTHTHTHIHTNCGFYSPANTEEDV